LELVYIIGHNISLSVFLVCFWDCLKMLIKLFERLLALYHNFMNKVQHPLW
jgi:flagellar biosynthesis protein FliR